MKKINILTIISLLLIAIFSCTEEFKENEDFNNNLDETTYAKVVGEESIVEVNVIKSGIDYKVTEMKITNRETNVTLPTIYHKFKLDKRSDNINDFSSTNGTYTIECNGIILYRMIIKNGEIESTEIINHKSLSSEEYPCTVRGIVTCADDEINDMNWIEYASCAISAPVCLATIYASCIWENC